MAAVAVRRSGDLGSRGAREKVCGAEPRVAIAFVGAPHSGSWPRGVRWGPCSSQKGHCPFCEGGIFGTRGQRLLSDGPSPAAVRFRLLYIASRCTAEILRFFTDANGFASELRSGIARKAEGMSRFFEHTNV